MITEVISISVSNTMLYTGIYGSTIYAEKKMPSEEFPHDQLFNGSAIPIKTHKRADEHYDKQKLFFSKGILIVRDPFDAIRANFNRRVAGSTAVVTEETFDQKSLSLSYSSIHILCSTKDHLQSTCGFHHTNECNTLWSGVTF